MSETFWKGEPVETLHRDVLVEIARQQHFRIETLMETLREIDYRTKVVLDADEMILEIAELTRAALRPGKNK